MSGVTPKGTAFNDGELSKLKSIDPQSTVPALAVHLLVDEIRRQRREMQQMADQFNLANRERDMHHRQLEETVARLRGSR